MNWEQAAELGAGGGAIFSLFAPWNSLVAAHQARREAMRVGKPLPRFRDGMDLLGDGVLFLVRAVFGAIAGIVFHTQLTPSATAGAIAIGASAPLLLRQLGHLRVISEAVAGHGADSTVHEPAGSAGHEVTGTIGTRE